MNEYFFHPHATSKQMDYSWEQGWRHFGAYFFRYSQTNGKHVLPLRIKLKVFKMSQSQKRILKKNQDLDFRVMPAFIDKQVETLFEKHKLRFKDNIPESIYTFMSESPATLPCICQSLCLYDQGNLIAISYLDMGEAACSSVYQCFDPAYEKRSLGILMILLSAQQSLKLGKTFYYPGYVFVEPSHYDYKKTFYGLEAFDWQGHWDPFTRLLR
jgi:arginine-tRNA-protein transferase